MSSHSSTALAIVTNQVVTVGAASATHTNPFGAGITIVRICATTACHVRMGNPTATAVTTDMYVPPNVPMFLSVAPGQKIAAIQNAAGGFLHVTEMSE
jgi:hypothetical protein